MAGTALPDKGWDGFSDEELIEKAKQKDKNAFTALYKKHNGRILSYLYRYIGDYQKAEDLMIDTFLNAYINLDKYRERGLFLSWLYKIATNCAKKELRKNLNVIEISMEKTSERDDEQSLSDKIGDERSRPDYNARQAELKEFVEKALSRLKSKYKDVLLLCDVEGLSYEEAAKTLNVTIKVVSMRLMRSRRMLFGILRKHGYVV